MRCSHRSSDVAAKFSSHINLLEADALCAYMRRLCVGGVRRQRVIVLLDSAVLIGAGRKGRSSSRALNRRLREVCALALLAELYLELCWVPTWSNAALPLVCVCVFLLLVNAIICRQNTSICIRPRGIRKMDLDLF